ncbi:MAG: Smr/MutS family protein [Bacilli bacterium]|nr:Smr/MutS family protein [Bacilli bacterium]
MMSIDDILFIDSLPTIDLHGYDRMYARLKVNEFINDNIKLKNEFIVIIHGIGSSVLKHEIHDLLSKDKRVIDYKIYVNNVGCTVAQLNINKV